MVLLTKNNVINSRKLLIALLRTIRAGWTPSSHFDLMAREFGISEGEPLIFFLTGIMQITREIPIKVYTDVTARTALLESLQSALDTAIEREESRILGERNSAKE